MQLTLSKALKLQRPIKQHNHCSIYKFHLWRSNSNCFLISFLSSTIISCPSYSPSPFLLFFRWWALRKEWRSSISSIKKPVRSNHPEISQQSSWWRASTVTSPHCAKWAQTLFQKKQKNRHHQKAEEESCSRALASPYTSYRYLQAASGCYLDWLFSKRDSYVTLWLPPKISWIKEKSGYFSQSG